MNRLSLAFSQALLFLALACSSANSDDTEDTYEQSTSTEDSGTGDVECPDVLDWIAIAGGTFQMGHEAYETDERPRHEVTVPDFEMTQNEITVDEYTQCVDAGACVAPENNVGKCNWFEDDRGEHPMNCVNWQQSVDFCRWACGSLPSESQWEYAARSQGKDNLFPWGDADSSVDYCDGYAVLNTSSDGSDGCLEEQTWPVCSMEKGFTEQGLCDMAGNVDEWIQDVKHASYVGHPTDGRPWEDESIVKRGNRGGSFISADYALRTTSRYSRGPNEVMGRVGFRCVRSDHEWEPDTDTAPEETEETTCEDIVNDSAMLNDLGHDTILCNHNQGHVVPQEMYPDKLLEFFAVHPLDTHVSPWTTVGLPDDYPDWCSFQPKTQ